MVRRILLLIFVNLAIAALILIIRSKQKKIDLISSEIILNDNNEILSACHELKDMSLKINYLTQNASPLCDLIMNMKLPNDYSSMLEYMNKFNEEIDRLGFKVNCQSTNHKGLVLHYIDDFMIKYKLKEQVRKVPEMRMVIESISKNDDSINVKITPLFLAPELLEFSINGESVGNKNPHCLEDNHPIDIEVKTHKLLHTETY